MRLFEKPLTNPETALRRLDEYSSLIMLGISDQHDWRKICECGVRLFLSGVCRLL